jgi:hypothetical protein
VAFGAGKVLRRAREELLNVVVGEGGHDARELEHRLGRGPDVLFAAGQRWRG